MCACVFMRVRVCVCPGSAHKWFDCKLLSLAMSTTMTHWGQVGFGHDAKGSTAMGSGI